MNEIMEARLYGARMAARDLRLWGLDAYMLRYPVPLRRYEMASGVEYRQEALWMHRRTAGMLYDGMVFVSGASSPEEARFTFTHEIAHRRLETNHVSDRDDVAEAAADAYAGSLLVPETVLRRVLQARGIYTEMPFLFEDLVILRDELYSVARGSDRREHFKVHVHTLVIALADAGLVEGEVPFENHMPLLRRLSNVWWTKAI